MLCPFTERIDNTNDIYCVAKDYFPSKYFPILEEYPKCAKKVCPFVAKETSAFVNCKEIEEMLWPN